MSTSDSASNTPEQTRIAFLNIHHDFRGIEEIVFIVEDSLRKKGAVIQKRANVREVNSENEDALLIIGSPVFYPGLLNDLSEWKKDAKRSVPVIFWHFEPLPDLETSALELNLQVFRAWLDAQRKGRYGMSRGSHFSLLRKAVRNNLFDHLFVYTPRKQLFLQKQGIPSTYLPMGYHPVFGERLTPQNQRDIDVLFLGQMFDNRRGRIVQKIKEALEAQGVHLTLMEEVSPLHGLWGEERTALLNRVKINLCIYQHPYDASGMRFSIGMGCGNLIVSEPVIDASPFVPMKHYVEAEVENLSGVILEYLKDEAKRQQVCDAAYDLMTEQFHMDTTAAVLIEKAKQLSSKRPTK
jgi:hypothetical protein